MVTPRESAGMNRFKDVSKKDLVRQCALLQQQNELLQQQDKLLHQLVAQLEKQNPILQNQLAEAMAKIQWLEEQLRLANQRRFGASSERTHEGQMLLFNEAEVEAEAVPPAPEPTLESITYQRHKAKGHREQIQADLKTNPLADGEQLNLIGYSGGGQVVLNAAEKLGSGVNIDNTILIGAPVNEILDGSAGKTVSIWAALDPLSWTIGLDDTVFAGWFGHTSYWSDDNIDHVADIVNSYIN